MMSGRIKRPHQKRLSPLPIIGKVKTGFKDDRGLPRSIDFFKPAGKYASAFTNAYGDKPNVIQIVFIDDDKSVSCNERYEYRDDKGDLFASGDGEFFKVWSAKDKRYLDFSIHERPEIMEEVVKRCPNKKGWEVILTLRFIIPKISGIVGMWEYSTKGDLSTIPQVTEAFDMMLNNRGFVSGIIFDLSVQFAKSQKPGVMSRYPVVSLVANQSESNVEMVKQNLFKIDQKNLLT